MKIQLWCKPVVSALFVFLVLVAAAGARAQQNYLEQIGPPPTDTVVPVQLGSIDLTTGNLHLEVPLGSFAQRGKLGYEAKLVYDSRIWSAGYWYPTVSVLSYRPFNVGDHNNYAMAGWRMVVNVDNTAAGAGASSSSTSCNTDLGLSSYTRYTGFSWRSPDGSQHTWGSLFTEQDFIAPGAAPCDGSSGNTPGAFGYADDGSGYYLAVTNYINMTVFAPDGTQVSPVFKDPNGNYFSNDANGNVIDTLGRTPVITTVSGNNIYYDVLNAQGTRSRYTVTTESIPVSVPNYSTSLTAVQSIGLPNGTSYQFGYDTGSTGDNWGGITSVTLPTGGQVTYGYTTFIDATSQVNAGAVSRWASSRIADGGNWKYTPKMLSSSSQQVTVTKPSQDYEVYTFQQRCWQFLLSQRDSHAADGTLLKTETIDWTPPVMCTTGRDLSTPTVGATAPVRITTITPGIGGTLTKKTEYDYTNAPSVGNPTKISEWNFYTGAAPANANRVRQIAYSFNGNATLAGAHIIDKPLTVTLTDGASPPNQIAQATYTYDNYSGNPLASTGACQTTSASQPSPAAPQHDYQAFCTSNTVRGNLTQVSKWLNTTGGSITVATNQFDDTGNIVQAKDALGNPTNFQFSPSFGYAYLTKATNALGQIATKNYDFNTGFVVSETDANGQTTGLKTSYTYDSIGRLIETDYPDGGQIKVNFNGDAIPLTITTTQLATPDPAVVKTTTLDGLGRPKTECLTDPEGNDCVDTGYDTNGRVGSKSNPHRTTAAASDGTTYSFYDGLDRTKSVTEADGNVVSTNYDTQTSPVLAQTVTAIDETLRQIRSATDGFGRMVEADESGDAWAGSVAGGSLTINSVTSNGGLQTYPGTSGAPGTGWFTVNGSEQSTTVTPPCESDMNTCPPDYTVYDYGSIVVTVNGFQATYNYGGGDTPTSVATGLFTALSGNSSPVYVSQNAATVRLTSKANGGNYALSTSSSTSDPTDFFGASFSASLSGSSLTGGTNGSPAVTDSGTVTISVGSNSATVNYGPGQDTTAAAVASDLAGKLTAQNPPFTVGVSGATLTFTWKTAAVTGNVAARVSSTTNQSAYFSTPSFTSPGTTLSGGSDPYPSGLAHPYVTRYFYDLLDNLTCVEQHGNVTGSGCSPAVLSPGSTVPAADATSPWRIRRSVFDSLSRMVWTNDPESGLTSNTYDNNGNLTTSTDARGVTINYSPTTSPIDALNRVTTITYSDGTPSVTYHYDVSCCGVTSANPIGRLVSVNTSNTELVFSYDPEGRTLTQWDCPPSGIARGYCYTISALYDLAGQMTSLTYPDGRIVTTNYSAAGRMTGVNLASFGGTAVNVPYYTVPQAQSSTSWGYWPSGAMNRGTFGNGVVETTGYGPRLLISSIADVKGTQTLLSKTYGFYDGSNHNNGDILSINDVLNSAKNQTYGYDALNRLLTGAQADNAFNITYTYDPWGNMKQSGTSNFLPNYDVHNRIQGSPYDAAGNLLNDGFHAYTYDGAGRMKNVDNTLASYTYNGVEHRVRKDTSTGSTEYFFFGEEIIAELNPASSAWTDYVFGYGGRIAKDTSANGTGAQYFHTDQVKSTRLVTDTNGGVVWQATYSPFGQELSAQNNAIAFQFAGLQYDSEDSLNHADFRQYASSQGRWLSPDPQRGSFNPANPQSANRYIYSLNNPLLLRDPSGLDPCDPSDTPVVAGMMPALFNLGLDNGSMLLFAPPEPDAFTFGDGDTPCLTPPPPNPPEIDPCQGKGADCYTQELADSLAGGLGIRDPACLLHSLREVVASGETPGEPNNGYGTVVGGLVLAAPREFANLIGTRNAHIADPDALTGHPGILVQFRHGPCPANCSTAFGRYQFLRGTAAALGMTDFSPAGQDAGADTLLRQSHAFRDASRGNIQTALADAGTQWASMPGSPFGQPRVSLARAVRTFINAATGCGGR
jgi:RHS repeat-associated protein